MKLILILFILVPSFLFGQEYHIRPCDPRYYKERTIKYRLADTVIKFNVCVDRLCHPDGRYYFYRDSTSKYPYSYETYKNGKTTYKKRIGKRKVEVYWDVGYVNYYDNGFLKDVEGRDTSAGYSTGNLKNFYFYYDSLGNLVSEIRNSFVGIDEHGQYVYRSMSLWRNGSGDTITFSEGLGLDHNSSEYKNKSYSIKMEYDHITGKKIGEKRYIFINRSSDNFSWDTYWLDDSTKISYDTEGNVTLKTQNRYINYGIFNKKEKFINDRLILRQFELTENFGDSNCNYAEFYNNGRPKYVKMSYCGEDTLITKYDSTGEETYREEIYVDGKKVKRYIYLFSNSDDRYFAKKIVCKRRRCKVWQYNDKGILTSKKRYRLSKGR